MAEYTESKKTRYLTLAMEIGASRARKELGYPNSLSTAANWAKARGVQLPLNEFSTYINAFKGLYSTEDKLAAVHLIIDHIVGKMTGDGELTSVDVKNYADAMGKLIGMSNEVEGKTPASAPQSQVDWDIKQLVEEQRKLNNEQS